jgi:glycosyltransferase involved in cell wall biosynthesis
MRIGYDARYINDRYHGIGRYAFQMLASLAEQGQQHSFTIFHGGGTDSRFNWNRLSQLLNVEMHAGPWPLYWPQEQLFWPRLLKKYGVDLFHTPYFVAPVWKSPLASSVPVIITVHDLIFDRYPDYMPAHWMRPYYKIMMELSMKRAEVIVTVSHHTANDLINYYNPPKEKITTIPEGVDPAFKIKKAEIIKTTVREKYNLQQPFVLSVGARRPHKNLARLVDAYASLADRIPHNLVLVGIPDRRFEDEALKSVEENDLTNRVKFLDWVPDVDLPSIYQLADLVVIPSIIEGFGLPVLEAMACGTPVAAADNSSLTEVAGEAGLYFDPLNSEQIALSMAEVLFNPDMKLRMAEAGIQRSTDFTWESAASALLSIYDRLNR